MYTCKYIYIHIRMYIDFFYITRTFVLMQEQMPSQVSSSLPLQCSVDQGFDKTVTECAIQDCWEVSALFQLLVWQSSID